MDELTDFSYPLKTLKAKLNHLPGPPGSGRHSGRHGHEFSLPGPGTQRHWPVGSSVRLDPVTVDCDGAEHDRSPEVTAGGGAGTVTVPLWARGGRGAPPGGAGRSGPRPHPAGCQPGTGTVCHRGTPQSLMHRGTVRCVTSGGLTRSVNLSKRPQCRALLHFMRAS
eukprot:768033-Hanusia_phi.AAC.4